MARHNIHISSSIVEHKPEGKRSPQTIAAECRQRRGSAVEIVCPRTTTKTRDIMEEQSHCLDRRKEECCGGGWVEWIRWFVGWLWISEQICTHWATPNRTPKTMIYSGCETQTNFS